MSILSSLLGLGQGQPTQVIPTAIAEPKIAEEIAPFLKDILGKGQALYKQRMDEGFVPYEGQTLADVTAQQKAAQEGIAGLVGTQKPIFDEAGVLVREGAEKATAEALQPYMNPYQQAVTDIAKRDAQERFEQTTLPGLRKQAIDAGAFGGSRAAMRESQAQDAQARLLADIQAKGDLAAFQNAQQQFAAQKAREAQTAQGLTGLGTAQYGAQLKELGQLEAVGREEQQRQQQLLDESYKRFLQERTFPEQQLGQYQQIVAGVPVGQSSITKTPQQFQPSPIAQAMGTATGLANIYGAFSGNPNFKTIPPAGQIAASGGQVIAAETGGGLSSLPVIQKRSGRQTIDPSERKSIFDKGMPFHFLKKLILSDEEYKASEDTKGTTIDQDIDALDDDAITTDKEEIILPEDQRIDPTKEETFPAGVTGESYGESTTTETGTGTSGIGQSSSVQDYLLSLIGNKDKYDESAETKALQEAIKFDSEENKRIYDAMIADKAFQRRQAALAGATKGLLSPKVGRGGIFADIQGGLLGATDELMEVGDNKDILDFMKSMSKDKRQSAILSAQTALESKRNERKISQEDFVSKLGILAQVAEFERLGIDLTSGLITDYFDDLDEFQYRGPEELKGLKSSITQKYKYDPKLQKLILSKLDDLILKGGGNLQNVQTVTEGDLKNKRVIIKKDN